jgi:hypothetical protein
MCEHEHLVHTYLDRHLSSWRPYTSAAKRAKTHLSGSQCTVDISDEKLADAYIKHCACVAAVMYVVYMWCIILFVKRSTLPTAVGAAWRWYMLLDCFCLSTLALYSKHTLLRQSFWHCDSAVLCQYTCQRVLLAVLYYIEGTDNHLVL